LLGSWVAGSTFLDRWEIPNFPPNDKKQFSTAWKRVLAPLICGFDLCEDQRRGLRYRLFENNELD